MTQPWIRFQQIGRAEVVQHTVGFEQEIPSGSTIFGSKGKRAYSASVRCNHVLDYKMHQYKRVRASLVSTNTPLRQAERGVSLARLALEEFAPHGNHGSAERFALLSMAEENVARARATQSVSGAHFAALAAIECSRMAVENLPWLGQVTTPIQA